MFVKVRLKVITENVNEASHKLLYVIIDLKRFSKNIKQKQAALLHTLWTKCVISRFILELIMASEMALASESHDISLAQMLPK